MKFASVSFYCQVSATGSVGWASSLNKSWTLTFTLQDPVTEEDDWYYPMKKQLMKFIFSALTLTFMVCLVLASVLSVIIYRVITSVRYCPGISAQACVLLTTVVSSLLNTISILILGKVTKYTEITEHNINPDIRQGNKIYRGLVYGV